MIIIIFFTKDLFYMHLFFMRIQNFDTPKTLKKIIFYCYIKIRKEAPKTEFDSVLFF